ncbi:MAG: phosphoribosyltransferase [Anaerolineae bacterium]
MLPLDSLQREVLVWDDIDKLIDHLMPQFQSDFDALLMITRGGMIPGGILCEAMDIKNVLTAAVHFDEAVDQRIAWPTFMQFPADTFVTGKRILVVDNIWGSGRTPVLVRGRLSAAGAQPEIAVLHFRPGSNIFHDAAPDYYGAITTRFIVYPWETPRERSSSFPPAPTSN